MHDSWQRIGCRIALGLYENETAAQCTHLVPAAHYLESWGDGRTYDGTWSLTQPLIEPLYAGKSAADVLAVLAHDAPPPGRALLYESWAQSAAVGGGKSLTDFAQALRTGFVADSATPTLTAALQWDAVATALQQAWSTRPTTATAGSYELTFRADARVYDGAFTNNAWLLELPEPGTTLTWGNAVILGPETATAERVASGDIVTLTSAGRTLRAPLLVVPGHVEGALSVTLGFGRDGAETVARGVGCNAYALRLRDTPFILHDCTLQPTGKRETLALAQTAQTQLQMADRDIIRSRPLSAAAPEQEAEPPTARVPAPTAGPQWGMAIDLAKCTGCSACVVACQAENNIPVVGRANVLKHRQMHWLRIDHYVDAHAQRLAVQPMACQHCENAPCEYVCPVGATTHSPDGLNEMTYNRCVGTRFCAAPTAPTKCGALTGLISTCASPRWANWCLTRT